MKAQVIQSFGDHSVFQLMEIEKPEIKSGHVIIKVHATSVNPIDTKVRSGAVAVAPAFPAVLHGDVAGVVVEIGENVTEFAVGDEVYGCAGGFKEMGGALSDYMLCDTRLIARKPKNLTMEEAAALPLVTITAWEALFQRAKIGQGDDILIHGACGGVGHVAVQLAKWAGAKVYTTVSSENKAQIAEKLGADVVINYKESSVKEYVEKYTDGKGFPYIFDTVGGTNLDRSFEAAAQNGCVAAIAARSTHDLSPLHAKGLSLHVTFMLLKMVTNELRQQNADILNQVTAIVEEGKLKPLIDKNMFTFDEVSAAHAYLESGQAVGKVVLKNNW